MADLPLPPQVATPVPPESVLTADVPRQLALAKVAWQPIGRAVRYASFDAWTLAIFAALSLPCAIGGVVGLALALVLAGCAYVEFSGVKRLRRLDLAAPRRLAINQLVLGGAIVIYSVWNLALVSMDRGMLAELNARKDELGDLGPDAAQMFKTVLYALYATLAIVGGGVPAFTAWFYTTRKAKLEAYLASTPPWVLQMQRDHGHL